MKWMYSFFYKGKPIYWKSNCLIYEYAYNELNYLIMASLLNSILHISIPNVGSDMEA